MKNRWIGPMLLAISLSLAACAPAQSSDGSSASPEGAPESAEAVEEAPSPSEAPTAEPVESTGPDDYDY